MKLYIKGQQFGTSGASPNMTAPLVAFDSVTGTEIVTICPDYFSYGGVNRGGTYSGEDLQDLFGYSDVDLCQVLSGVKTRLAARVNASTLYQDITDAYLTEEDTGTVYVSDFVDVVAESDCYVDPEDYTILLKPEAKIWIKSDSDWTITSGELEFDTDSGTGDTLVTIKSFSSLTGQMVVTTNGGSEVVCNFKANDWYIDVSPQSLQLDSSGPGYIRLHFNGITSGGTITYEIPKTYDTSWLTINPSIVNTSGDESIDITGTLVCSAKTNPYKDARTTYATFEILLDDEVYWKETLQFDQPGRTDVTITSPQSGLEYPSNAQNIEITATATKQPSAWYIRSDSDWCRVSTVATGSTSYSGQISLTENTSSSTRTATVTVSADSYGSTVVIKQIGQVDLEIAFTDPQDSTTSLPESGSTGTYSVKANKSVAVWSINSSADWLVVNPGSVDSTGTVYSGSYTATENSTGGTRTATITVTGDDQSDTRTFTQKSISNPVKILVSKTSIDLDSSEAISDQPFLLMIRGLSTTPNYSFNVTTSEDWLSVNSSDISDRSSGLSVDFRGNLRYSATENTSTTPRSASFRINYLEGSEVKAYQDVLVNQPGGSEVTLKLLPASVALSDSETTGQLTVDYTGRDNLSVQSSANWLTAYLSNTKVVYTAQANTSETPRTATVTVTDGNLSAASELNQSGITPPKFSVFVSKPVTSIAKSWEVTKARTTGSLEWSAEGNSYGLATSISSSTDVDWIYLADSTGLKSTTESNFSLNETRSLVVSQNTGKARTGLISLYVTFDNSVYNYRVDLRVNQAEGGEDYLVISPESVQATKDAKDFVVNFSYPAEDTITQTLGESWITAPTRISQSGDYTFKVAANTSGNARSTTLKYTTQTGLSKTLTFTQTGNTESVASITWTRPADNPKILTEGTYTDTYDWSANGSYSGDVTPTIETTSEVNNKSVDTVTVYPEEVNQQVYSNGNIQVRQAGTISVNPNSLQEGTNTVTVIAKVNQGSKQLATRSQTWIMVKPKSSPSGSGSGSYDPGDTGSADIPVNYITLDKSVPFYVVSGYSDFTFTATYSGPYSGSYSINTTGVTEVSRIDTSTSTVANVQVTYRVTSTSQVTLRFSDSVATREYKTIQVYSVNPSVVNVSQDVILNVANQSRCNLEVVQNGTGRIIWNDLVYSQPDSISGISINATEMLRDLTEAPETLQLNAIDPQNLDTYSFRFSSGNTTLSLTGLSIVDDWSGLDHTSGRLASTYPRNLVAQDSYIPVSLIDGGSVTVVGPTGITEVYRGLSGKSTHITVPVKYCGTYKVGSTSLSVVNSRYVLYYFNSLGGWSSLVTEAVDNPGYNYTRNTCQPKSSLTRNYQVVIKPTWTLRTGWTSESDLVDLFGSARVLLYDTRLSRLTEVSVTDSTSQVKTFRNNGRKLVNYEINLESSLASQRR